MTNTAETSSLDRAAALAHLLAGTTPGVEVAAPAPKIVPTGREVYAGGTIARVLLTNANLIYLTDDVPPAQQRADAHPFDTVLLDKAQADRLDKLGVVIDPAKLEEANAEVAKVPAPDPAKPPTGLPPVSGELLTDDAIRTGKAEDLVAYVGQHPEQRARVRALEEERVESKRRSSVLNATEPTPVEDDEVARLKAEQQAADEQANAEAAKAAEVPAKTPEQIADEERQQAEDAAAEALAALAGGGAPVVEQQPGNETP